MIVTEAKTLSFRIHPRTMTKAYEKWHQVSCDI